jgi:hypothetical protein
VDFNKLTNNYDMKMSKERVTMQEDTHEASNTLHDRLQVNDLHAWVREDEISIAVYKDAEEITAKLAKFLFLLFPPSRCLLQESTNFLLLLGCLFALHV